MSIELGIILAFAAMLCWGFGDFLIQKSTRKFGDWETLFIITIFGSIVLFPFVYKEIPSIFSFHNSKFLLLITASVILLFAALFEFESLKKGKISVVEPIWSMEIPASALLAFLIIKENVSLTQIILIVALIFGLILVSLRSYHLSKHIWLEKAAFLALASALMMGAANFFVGWGSRETGAFATKWFVDTFIALVSFIYIFSTKRIHRMELDISKNKKLLGSMCVLDNAAWVAFGFSMVLAPISIAVAISESYIIICVLLGMFVAKEKLRIHQKIGLILAIIAAISLAVMI